MAKKKNSRFKDDIREIIIVHALTPVLLIILIFLIIVFVIYNYIIITQNREAASHAAGRIAGVVSSYMEKCGQAASGYDVSRLKGTSESISFSEDLYNLINSQPIRASFFVLDSDAGVLMSSTEAMPYFIAENDMNWGVMRKMNQSPGETVMEISSFRAGGARAYEIEIGRAVVRDGELLGYVVFTINADDFFREVSSLPTQIVATDRFGNAFLATTYRFHTEMNKVNIENATGYMKYDKESFYINKLTVLDGAVHVYSITSTSNMLTLFAGIILMVVLIFLLVMFAVFMSASKISDEKTKIIDELVNAFKCVQNEQLDVYLDISTNDEFEIIGKAYNLMLDSIKDLIKLNEERARENMLAEIKQLESQFNPHFLFNTLESIRFMTRMDPLSADKMILNLSNLLRYSIQSGQNAVTIKEDIEYTQSYLAILSFRFGNRLKYVIDIPNETENCIIPKLLFQPIIENSIKYGFGVRDEMEVRVSAAIIKGKLIIVISDDGEGIDPDMLEKIKSNLKNKRNESSNIGLYNIHRRINLIFGEGYGLAVTSEKDRGAEVRISLPANFRFKTEVRKC